MAGEDAGIIKEKIVSLLKRDGPNMPVKIAREVGSNTLFTSAFLSELFAEKVVLMSNLRIGSSPLFFIPGQEPMLEKFSDVLKSKEREAFLLLKEKKFLKDVEQLPPIRVALREIKDFASAFEKNGEIIWRFFTIPESEFEVKPEPIIVQKEVIEIEPTVKIKKKRKKSSKKSAKNEEFLNKVKKFLSKKSHELIEILHHGKDEIVMKIKDDNEKILVAYDKKKLTEKDVVKAAKRASEHKLPFKIYSHGDLPKKTKEFIDLVKNMTSVEKMSDEEELAE